MMETGMGIWILVAIGILAVVVPGIVLLMVWVMRKIIGKGGDSDGGDALDILKKRYALGEISKEEFEGKRRDILA